MHASERARKTGRWLLSRCTVGVLGRKNTARLARMLGNEARLDEANDQYQNGERQIQAAVMGNVDPEREVVVIDIGANVGDWTAMLLDEANKLDRRLLRVFAFEPANRTFARLSKRMASRGDRRVELVNAGASNAPGEMTLHVPGGDAGTSSLHGASVDVASEPETVRLTTVDQFCETHDISSVDLLKIDTEGHDVLVLEGARGLLARRAISVVQFEYNHRWIFARKFLRDVFELLSPLGYSVGKVTRLGIERYEGWHPELETFREGNYLAFLPEWRDRFPEIRWWNAENAPNESATEC